MSATPSLTVTPPSIRPELRSVRSPTTSMAHCVAEALRMSPVLVRVVPPHWPATLIVAPVPAVLIVPVLLMVAVEPWFSVSAIAWPAAKPKPRKTPSLPMFRVEKVLEAVRLSPMPPLTMPERCSATWSEKLPEMAARLMDLVTTEPAASMVTLVDRASFNTMALAFKAAMTP